MMLSSCCHQSILKKSGVNWACENNRTGVFLLATIHRVQDLRPSSCSAYPTKHDKKPSQ